ncbi:MAG: methylenetetrahydrofolate--tRNA-(uracil(54)-C(5))-methyltransferase (FADH(2)-oxidizing) TrmFO [Deltaproteobacteria bacterium]|nr:methylenetetrahydrofolate--tRNA-(uracil(54)-C(5))-methyltransferase (FADH(2)-oxidizing) TrmFO [Deltaproteobacteria bacterium]
MPPASEHRNAPPVVVIGEGLAGSEAAWQLARRGYRVRLHEMRPGKMTPAHRTANAAELVCSNSFKSIRIESAQGVMKRELEALDSLVLRCAHAARIPGGEALVVDRDRFAAGVEAALLAEPLIERVPGELERIPDDPVVIVATGPLTSDALSTDISRILGEKHLAFYDAISPIVDAESVDGTRLYRLSRYGHGGDDYWNIPLDQAAYYRLVDQLVAAEPYPEKSFENLRPFEGCMPIEDIARRGRDTLRFGPLKPVGLPDPRTGRDPYAVVQLRMENREATMWSLVAFQTKLRHGDQMAILRSLPGLEQAEFLRLGSIHRNTFVCAPRLLDGTLQAKARKGLYFAGQITGVEGYTESTVMGAVAALHAVCRLQGKALPQWPRNSAIGSLLHYLKEANPETFQPMNFNWGLLEPLGHKARKEERHRLLGERAWAEYRSFLTGLEAA